MRSEHNFWSNSVWAVASVDFAIASSVRRVSIDKTSPMTNRGLHISHSDLHSLYPSLDPEDQEVTEG